MISQTVGVVAEKSERPSRLLTAAAFAAVYFFWGSTYLAIRLELRPCRLS